MTPLSCNIPYTAQVYSGNPREGQYSRHHNIKRQENDDTTVFKMSVQRNKDLQREGMPKYSVSRFLVIQDRNTSGNPCRFYVNLATVLRGILILIGFMNE